MVMNVIQRKIKIKLVLKFSNQRKKVESQHVFIVHDKIYSFPIPRYNDNCDYIVISGYRYKRIPHITMYFYQSLSTSFYRGIVINESPV